MGYPKHLIDDDETVVLDLKPHWWYFSRHILTGIPLFIIFVLMFQLSGTVQDYAWYIFGALALAWAIWLGFKYVEWTFTHFVVSDRRVIFRTGVLAKHGTEIPLERITNINFAQPIIDRMIGAGDLDIESAGTQGQSHFENVRHPDAVQQEIYRQIEVDARRRAGWIMAPGTPAAAAAGGAQGADRQAAPGAAPRASSDPGASVPDQIEQLAELRDAGHITPEEYEAKKAELLGRM